MWSLQFCSCRTSNWKEIQCFIVGINACCFTIFICFIWKGRTNQRFGGNNKMNMVSGSDIWTHVHQQKKELYISRQIYFLLTHFMTVHFISSQISVPPNRIKDKTLWFQLFDTNAFYLYECDGLFLLSGIIWKSGTYILWMDGSHVYDGCFFCN